ncbi:methyltransferase family protein [Maribellus sediminis]|uniref:methyltransferase family protein n=1 Tax=Maribellus sediminis TaxID=2696285 RepID=UPI00142F7AEE|nr:isoprenylcysteine carboxylmethyltransferase family protein [Maribellus sediminis]
MKYLLAFILVSLPVLLISWKSLKAKGSHGFYRFFSWEAILVLLIFKIEFWFKDPFSWNQIISWILLFSSLYFVLAGTVMLKKKGQQKKERREENLYAFERTSKLVTTGIYKYIRHPLYASLLLLAWGAYLKQPDWILIHITIFASSFLYLTARADEKECIAYFGAEYEDYMKVTKRFIPFLF